MEIKFLQMSGEVTGSKTLITTRKGVKILLDCGMYQGKGLETDGMNRNLGFEPSTIDYVLLSHAHIDHSGLIPYIYKLGFRGKVVCTNATFDLCSIMLIDSGRIQESDTHDFLKKMEIQGKPITRLDPLYTAEEAEDSLTLFESYDYNEDITISDEVTVRFTNTGHMLGGGAINIKVKEGKKVNRVCYTGDIGRYNKELLPDPQKFPQADYIITEATYGDRRHVDMVDAEQELLVTVLKACCQKKGKLIIPAFAVGRTQEIVSILDRLSSKGLLPNIDVFVDSPMAVSATAVFRKYADQLNEQAQKQVEFDGDPFGFNKLHYIRSASESKQLNERKKPCIIISASGMMEAGRIKHHLANSIDNPRNTILAVGYCSPTTLGARILRGDKKISIFGLPHTVRASIRRIDALSGHGDYVEMGRFLSCQNASKVKKLFIVHGEKESKEAYKKYLETIGFKDVEIAYFRNAFNA